jgi:hypothetical protein
MLGDVLVETTMREYVETVRDNIGVFKLFVRVGYPYQKARYVAAFLVFVAFALSLAFLLPNADYASVQTGLVAIAEILGVLLGVVLVAIVLMVEQGRQAEDVLTTPSQTYRELVAQHIEDIDNARRALIASARRGVIQLDQPQGRFDLATNREVIGSLSSLIVVYRPEMFSEVLEALTNLGYTEEEKDAIFSDIARLGTGRFPGAFLTFLSRALNRRFLPLLPDRVVRELVSRVDAGYLRDGVPTALRRLETSKRVLRSKTLALTVVVPALITALDVMVLFGITEDTVCVPLYRWLIILIMAGFAASLVLVLFLINKMLA